MGWVLPASRISARFTTVEKFVPGWNEREKSELSRVGKIRAITRTYKLPPSPAFATFQHSNHMASFMSRNAIVLRFTAAYSTQGKNTIR